MGAASTTRTLVCPGVSLWTASVITFAVDIIEEPVPAKDSTLVPRDVDCVTPGDGDVLDSLLCLCPRETS